MNIEEKIEFTKKDRYLIGIPFVLVFILVISLVENDILRHILLTLDLTILGALGCYFFSLITERKELKIFFLLALFSGLLLPYLFSWVHEFSHAFTILFIDEIDFLGIEVVYPYGGITRTRQPLLIFDEDLLKLCWLNFSGSVGSIIIVLIFNRIIYHTKKISFSWFLPLFTTTSWWILYELGYWISGIDYYLDGNEVLHDAYRFLYYYLHIDNPVISIDPLILRNLVICFAIFFLIWSVLNIRKRIKKIRNSER